MTIENHIILIISHEKWGVIWYSKHHYANYLSLKNKVYFINPAQSLNPFEKITIEKVSDSLSQVSYSNFLPFTGRSEIINKFNDWIIANKIKRQLKLNLSKKEVILWSFDPQRLINPKFFSPVLSVYHCMDSFRMERESTFIKNVDLVIVVSKHFQELFKGFNKNIIKITHAVQERIEKIEEILDHSDYFLLIGNISYRFDYKVLIATAEKYQNKAIKLVGPVDYERFTEEDKTDIEKLKSFPNITFLGPKSYSEIVPLIKGARICLVSYKTEYFYSRLNSLKIMQYLNYGKCVVSSFFEEYEDKPELIWMSADNSNFVVLIEEALKEENNNKASILSRLKYTNEYTYPSIIRKIETYIDKNIKI